MFNEYKIDNYQSVESDIHNLNPVYKVISLFVVIISIFMISSLHDFMFCFLILLFILNLSNIPYKIYLKNVWNLRVLIIFIILINLIFRVSFYTTFITVFQIIMVVSYTTMITYTTAPMEIAYGLEKSLSFLNVLHIPVNKLSLSLTLVLRFIPNIYEEAGRILKSQSTRGIDYYNSNLKGKLKALSSMMTPMFISSLKKSDDVADMMSIRLYGYAKSRTNYQMHKWTIIDSLMLVINLLILIAIIIL